MGNAQVPRVDEPRVLLTENPSYHDLAYRDLLASYKLFKVMRCAHEREGDVVVKLFIHREGAPDLRDVQRKILQVKDAFRSHWLHPNVVPYQAMEITAQSSVLLRQHFSRNLNDRIHTRPFMSLVEKKWLAFQVISAVCQAHSVGVAHGDIKAENVFVSSWNHAILTDFATFKPLMLPEDDPSEFSFFFESDRNRHRCYLAPERFVDGPSAASGGGGGASGSSSAVRGRFSRELAAMDIFSLGCVLAELFLDGQTLLDLPQLRAYRLGQAEVLTEKLRGADGALGEASGGVAQELISSMLNRDPTQRKTAVQYLREWCQQVLPKSFCDCLFPLSVLLLHPLYQQPDMRVALLRHNFAGLLWSVAGRKALALRVLEHDRPAEAEPSGTSSAAEVWEAWFRHVERKVRSIDDAVMHTMVSGAVQACGQWTAEATHGRSASRPPATVGEGKASSGAEERVPRTSGVGNGQAPCRLAQPWLREAPCRSFSAELFRLWDEGCRRCSTTGQIDEGEHQSGVVYETFLAELCQPSPHSASQGSPPGGPSSASAAPSARQRKVPVPVPVPAPPGTGDVSEEGEEAEDVLGIVCSFICSSAQHVSNPRARLACLDMLELLAAVASQDTILEQIVPYSHALMTDPVAKVRARAVDVLTRSLERVRELPASNAPLFMEYVFPQLMSAISGMQSEPVVLVAVARNIGALSAQAVRFAELSVAAAQKSDPSASQQTPGSASRRPTEANAAVEVETFDVQCKHLQEATKKIVKALLEYLPGPLERHSGDGEEEALLNLAVGREVKIALLRNMCVLADSFGRDGTHNFLLPYLISFMNDPAWEVRAAFCEEAALLPKKVGQVSSEGIIWPCYEQALLDQEERVLEAALKGLAVLASQQVLRRQSLVTVATKVAPLLVHPSSSIRRRAVEALSSLASQLSPVDQHVFLLPAVKPFLHLEGASLSALTAGLLAPSLCRRTFKHVLLRRDEELHEALLHRRPLPSIATASSSSAVPGSALGAQVAEALPKSEAEAVSTKAPKQEADGPDIAALELLRPYVHLLLRSRPSKAPSAGVGTQREELGAAQAVASKVQSLQYATVNPHGAPNRSLAALAEASSLRGEKPSWPPPVPRDRLRHPLGVFSMQTFLVKALCLPPRPCQLGSLSFLDGTPYSIYALSAGPSGTSVSVSSSARADASAEGGDLRAATFHGDALHDSDTAFGLGSHGSGGGASISGGQDLCDSAEPSVDAVVSSMMVGDAERHVPSPPPFRGMWPRSSEHTLPGALDTEAGERSGPGLGRSPVSSRPTWRPKGQLLATLYEYAHQSGVPVVKVDTTDDSRILVTGGRDGVVKIWSSAQLERDTAVASSHTFCLPTRPGAERRQRLRALRTVRNSKAVAVGSETGEVLLYKVEPSRGGATAVQACRFSAAHATAQSARPAGACAVTCIEQFDTELESLVVFAQEHGAVHGWDVRSPAASWALARVPPWLGVPSCLALGSDGHSAIVGTLGGGLLLYDLRFLAPWKSWKVSSGAGVLSMRSADFGPSQGVFVALGSECNEVALFDVARGSCLTLFLTDSVVEKPKEAAVSVPTLLPIPTITGGGAGAGVNLHRSPDQLHPLLPGGRKANGSVRALWLPPRGAQTFLLAGGTDRKVRHWSLDPERHAAEAYVVTPPHENGGSDREMATYSSNHLGDVFVVQEQPAPTRPGEAPTWATRAGDRNDRDRALDSNRPSAGASPNHRDAILDMCTISLQNDILVTAGRDGLVKLWR